jgi:membrane-bound lytic murein transglycosylase D
MVAIRRSIFLRERKTGLAILFALLVSIWGCASPGVPWESLQDTEKPQSLVPKEFICPELAAAEKPDPRLALEIKTFLEESGILLGYAQAGDLPVVLNGPVQAYLRGFSTTQKAAFETYLKRSGRYLPMMRRIFKEHGLPQDLVYLALIESGFNPWARSPAAAVGPWQFIEGTARCYNLKVNNWVDERRDPEKATRAAARYLKDLYKQFGCWYLAAAAYNAGEHRVGSAVRKAAVSDFWTLAKNGCLPQETCQYVPKFIAAALIAKSPGKYGFTAIGYQQPLDWERIKIPGGTDLRAFAQSIDVAPQVLRELNPELQGDMTPKEEQGYVLKIPRIKKGEAQRLARICWQTEK